ncbi:hypothetical protein [Afipia sp. GAS231]|uniref:hypothetical protein n=1 Tax=Afipia sp. GAS231 TaxID=1882747 RepID=UPI0012F7F463|nr:hypothetical protein [Afipia sp. GAS231]
MFFARRLDGWNRVDWVEEISRGAQAGTLDPSQPDAGDWGPSCPRGQNAARPVSAGRMNANAAEEHMTVAQQAFLFTGEIFVLSFVAIYVMWFVDRLLRNFRR